MGQTLRERTALPYKHVRDCCPGGTARFCDKQAEEESRNERKVMSSLNMMTTPLTTSLGWNMVLKLTCKTENSNSFLAGAVKRGVNGRSNITERNALDVVELY